MSHSHQLAVKKRNLQRAQQRRLHLQQQLQEKRALVEAVRVHSQHQQAVQQQQQQPPQQLQDPHEPEETPPHEEDDMPVFQPPQLKKKDKEHHRHIMGFHQPRSSWRKVKSMSNLDTDIVDTPQDLVYPVFKRVKSASAIEPPCTISLQDAHEVTSALLHVLDKKPGEKLIITKLLRGNTIARLTTDDVSTVVAIADLSESRSTVETADTSFQSFPPSSDIDEDVVQSSDNYPTVTTPTETSPPPYKTPNKFSNWDYHLSKFQTGAQLLAKEIIRPQDIPSSSTSALISAPTTTATTSARAPLDNTCEYCRLCNRSAGAAAYFALTLEKRQSLKCTCGKFQEVLIQQSQAQTSSPIPQPEVPPTEVAPDTQPKQRRNTRFGGIPQGIWDKTHNFLPNKKK